MPSYLNGNWQGLLGSGPVFVVHANTKGKTRLNILFVFMLSKVVGLKFGSKAQTIKLIFLRHSNEEN